MIDQIDHGLMSIRKNQNGAIGKGSNQKIRFEKAIKTTNPFVHKHRDLLFGRRKAKISLGQGRQREGESQTDR